MERPVERPTVTTPVRMIVGRRFLRRSLVLWTTFGGIFFVFYSIQTFMPTVVASMGFTLSYSEDASQIRIGSGLQATSTLPESWPYLASSFLIF